MTTVSRRARVHVDRGGDPLDGLVNLFDLGIVLAVAFLLAALSSVDLTGVFTDQEALQQAQAAANVTAAQNEVANEIQLQPGEKVVGNGEVVGTVYQLDDGRTVIVRPDDSPAAPGEGGSVLPDDTTTPPTDGTTTPDGTTPAPDTGSGLAPPDIQP